MSDAKSNNLYPEGCRYWAGWKSMESAPTDGREVWVMAAPYQDLPGFVVRAAYHPDAGWCVDELREAILWADALPPSEVGRVMLEPPSDALEQVKRLEGLRTKYHQLKRQDRKTLVDTDLLFGSWDLYRDAWEKCAHWFIPFVRATLEQRRPTHRHKKRGSEYVLLGIGRIQSDEWVVYDDVEGTSAVDMSEVAIYRSVADGSLWARPIAEFEDGRFERLQKGTEDAL